MFFFIETLANLGTEIDLIKKITDIIWERCLRAFNLYLARVLIINRRLQIKINACLAFQSAY